MRTPEGSINIKISIPGLFSVFNALGAAAACMLLGFDADHIREGLAKLKSVSGRLEPLPTDGDYSVLLDMRIRPMRLKTCCARCAALPAAGWLPFSAAAATATRQSAP